VQSIGTAGMAAIEITKGAKWARSFTTKRVMVLRWRIKRTIVEVIEQM
jgi:hypothetical protein